MGSVVVAGPVVAERHPEVSSRTQDEEKTTQHGRRYEAYNDKPVEFDAVRDALVRHQDSDHVRSQQQIKAD